jgi:hypothetical protein
MADRQWFTEETQIDEEGEREYFTEETQMCEDQPEAAGVDELMGWAQQAPTQTTQPPVAAVPYL